MNHLKPELLRMVLDGELPPKALLRLLVDHLTELCPECGAAWEEARATHPGPAPEAAGHGADAGMPDTGMPSTGMPVAAMERAAGTPALPGGRYAGAFERVAAALGQQRDAVTEERERARCDAAELLELVPQRRRLRVEAEVGDRFRGRALVQRLLEASFEAVRRDAAEALDLAELAAVVLRRTLARPAVRVPGKAFAAVADGTPDWAHEQGLLCLAHAANALRVGGHLPAADLMFGRLHRRREERGVADGLVAAELASLEASLRLDQGRFADAAGLLDRASRAYADCGAEPGRAKVDLQRATLLYQRGELEEAAALLDGLTADGSALPPALRRHAVANRALVLCDLDRPAHARELLAGRRSLFTGGGPWEALRLRWLEGRIALGLDELAEAQAALEEARRGFLDRGEGYTAALASLDLAAVHATAGRTAAVRELAAGLEPVFASRDVDRETVATLVLFRQAAAAERAGRDFILRLRKLLERGRSGRRTTPRPC